MPKRGSLLVAEGGITPVDDAPEVVGRDLGGGDVERKDVEGELGKWQIFPTLPAGRLRDLLGDVQAAVGGEALEHDVFEGQLGPRGQPVSTDRTAAQRSRRGDDWMCRGEVGRGG